jgi:hypothetical protein
VIFRFFAGLTVDETPIAIDFTPGVIKQEWQFALVWLHNQINQEG